MTSGVDAPRFSVIIPAFNAERTIVPSIRSVLRQTRSDLEVVVVDDGSLDRTGAFVRGVGDPRVHLVSQANRGLPAARNAGIAAARGQLIAFLDSDDLLLPAFLERANASLEATPQAGFAYTDAYVLDDASGRIRVRSAMARNQPPVPPPEAPERFLALLLRSNFVFVSALVPRAVIDQVGGFDERRTSSEDYELWLKIAIAGYRVAWIPGCQAIYRRHAGQMSNNMPTMFESLKSVFDDIALERLASDELRRIVLERRRLLRRQAALSVLLNRIPARLISAARRARSGELWYDAPPPEVAATLARDSPVAVSPAAPA